MKIILLLLAAWILFFAIRELDWKQFLKDKTRQNLCVVSVLILTGMWSLQTGIKDNLEVHFLGLTALTLVVGWRLSIVTAAVATLLVTILGVASWADLGENLLLGAIWPISLSYFIFLLTYSYLTRHLFVYTFVAGFFNAVLVICAKMFAIGLYLAWTGVYSWSVIKADYLIIMPLMAFPEGLINGMTITALVVYKPEWVCTFLDRDYLVKEEK